MFKYNIYVRNYAIHIGSYVLQVYLQKKLFSFLKIMFNKNKNYCRE